MSRNARSKKYKARKAQRQAETSYEAESLSGRLAAAMTRKSSVIYVAGKDVEPVQIPADSNALTGEVPAPFTGTGHVRVLKEGRSNIPRQGGVQENTWPHISDMLGEPHDPDSE